jgi:phosphoglycolate phosphatase-like HAD superfamily hydrolase
MNNPSSVLADFPKSHPFFVGIDSDGCAFDTMELKHKQCFIPEFIQHFELQAVAEEARAVAEFVNLYSIWRGTNRFPAYARSLKMLAEHPEVVRRGHAITPRAGLSKWVSEGKTFSDASLRQAIEQSDHPDLHLALAWSVAVNTLIRSTVQGVPPFAGVKDVLEALDGKADVMVVSATPGEALQREWNEHELARHVALIAGQELGSKAEILARATAGRYEPDHVLMIGDAPGDRAAAEANSALFFPILPGREAESWRKFRDEALNRFLAGTYRGDYMDARLAEFEALLPSTPHWKIG